MPACLFILSIRTPYLLTILVSNVPVPGCHSTLYLLMCLISARCRSWSNAMFCLQCLLCLSVRTLRENTANEPGLYHTQIYGHSLLDRRHRYNQNKSACLGSLKQKISMVLNSKEFFTRITRQLKAQYSSKKTFYHPRKV